MVFAAALLNNCNHYFSFLRCEQLVWTIDPAVLYCRERLREAIDTGANSLLLPAEVSSSRLDLSLCYDGVLQIVFQLLWIQTALQTSARIFPFESFCCDAFSKKYTHVFLAEIQLFQI